MSLMSSPKLSSYQLLGMAPHLFERGKNHYVPLVTNHVIARCRRKKENCSLFRLWQQCTSFPHLLLSMNFSQHLCHWLGALVEGALQEL